MEKYPDYVVQHQSVRVDCGEDEQIVDKVYDNVHLFRPLGHAIVKLVTTEGFRQWHIPIAYGERIAAAAGITPVEREDITIPEYETYLKYQEKILNDSWLED